MFRVSLTITVFGYFGRCVRTGYVKTRQADRSGAGRGRVGSMIDTTRYDGCAIIIQLRREIQAGLERLFALPRAAPGHTEDVHHTLRPQTPTEIGPDNPMRFAFHRTPIREP